MIVEVDGKRIEVEEGTTLGQIFKRLNIKGAIGGKVGDRIYDLQTPLREGGKVKVIREGDEEGLEILRHSLAHIMAQALKEIYGKERVHLGIGPTTEDGFFYDVEVEGHSIKEEDLPKIEEKMREIVRKNYPIKRKKLSREESLRLFKELGEKYKLEIIENIPKDEEITVYEQGDFVDLCKGPHLPSTGLAKNFKLTSISGAYWKGRSDAPQLQRIYGIAYWDEESLKKRLKFYEEVKERDHRRLGRELEFFYIDESVGAGLVLWLPKGGIYRKVLEDFLREEHLKRGYKLVFTPHVGKAKLWQISGHLEHYKENMFPEMKMEEESYFVKPMNCPFHIAIYKERVRSYKDLPFKIFELGSVYRYELSGVLHGLLRVRGFTQDDAHIICTKEQVKDVIKEVLDFAFFVLGKFGFKKYKIYLSTKPESYIGSEEEWEVSQNALREALQELKKPYEIDEGGGAFYGPKIDVKIEDALGRLWQCSTVQFDFNLPKRFDMTYVGKDNRRHRPYMIHRALLGSIERFTGILLEHHKGNLPFWLSPVQVKVLTLSKDCEDFAREVSELLRENRIRVEEDFSSSRLSAKIRRAELEKVPYMVIVGRREKEERRVSLRKKGEGDLGRFTLEEALNLFKGMLK